MSKHTPEPWEMDSEDRGKPVTYSEGFSIFAPNDEKKYFDICFIPTAETEIYGNHPKGHGEDKAIANAERIVACVNGCAGINPEAVPDLVEAATKAMCHIDEKNPQKAYDILLGAVANTYPRPTKARSVP